MLFSKDEFLAHFKPWRKWVVGIAIFFTVWDVGLMCILGGTCRDSLFTSYLIIWLSVLPLAALGASLHILLKPVVLWLKERNLLLPVCIALTILMIFIWWNFFKVLLMIWFVFGALAGAKRLRGNDDYAHENEANRAASDFVVGQMKQQKNIDDSIKELREPPH